MNIIKKLSNEMHASKTIKPSFKLVHLLLSLVIFQQETQGIGRYRLENELCLSEGKVRSLLKHMKQKHLIEVDNKLNVHVLTEKGYSTLIDITKILTPPKEPNFEITQIVIGDFVRYSIVHNGRSRLKTGLEQRDEAIKIGGSGATCLIMKNGEFFFPPTPTMQNTSIPVAIDPNNLNYPFSESDVLVLGTGKSQYLANLAAIAAALSLAHHV